MMLDRSNNNLGQWRQEWPKLKHGGRHNHASVVLDDNDMVIVLGGNVQGYTTNSVIVLPTSSSSSSKWLDGPPMNNRRTLLAAVICNNFLYAIGGEEVDFRVWDTIERISLSTLMMMRTVQQMTSSRSISNISNNNNNNWELMSTRLSSPRYGCAAVAVHNRFVVVLGGGRRRNNNHHNNNHHGGGGISEHGEMMPLLLSTIDIIDTTNDMAITVSVGPSMILNRCCCAAVVLHDEIWVIGGQTTTTTTTTVSSSSSNHPCPLPTNTVESISFNSNIQLSTMSTMSPTTSSLLFSDQSTWTIQTKFTLPNPRTCHSVCLVGNCIVVAGGRDDNGNWLTSVNVLDPLGSVLWNLPDLTVPRYGCTMMTTTTTTTINTNQQLVVVVLGGFNNYQRGLNSIESVPFLSLSLTNMKATVQRMKEEMSQQQQEQQQQELALTQQQQIVQTNQQWERTRHKDNNHHDIKFLLLEEQQDESMKTKQQMLHIQRLCDTLVFYYLSRIKTGLTKT